jgi:putative flippase GtrA
MGRVAELRRTHAEKIRFLVVGVWNTFFGIGLYTLLVTLLGKQLYLLLVVPVNIVAITQNFVLYKFLVFRTKGHYLREYLRFYIVYGPPVLVNLFVLPLLVRVAGLDPRIAQFLFTGVVVFVSWFGHKYFTFRTPTEEVAEIDSEETAGE